MNERLRTVISMALFVILAGHDELILKLCIELV